MRNFSTTICFQLETYFDSFDLEFFLYMDYDFTKWEVLQNITFASILSELELETMTFSTWDGNQGGFEISNFFHTKAETNILPAHLVS